MCRIGGEEFLIVLPYQTQQEAEICAHRCRQAVSEERFEFAEQVIHATISAGVASRRKDMAQCSELLVESDEAALRGQAHRPQCGLLRPRRCRGADRRDDSVKEWAASETGRLSGVLVCAGSREGASYDRLAWRVRGVLLFDRAIIWSSPSSRFRFHLLLSRSDHPSSVPPHPMFRGEFRGKGDPRRVVAPNTRLRGRNKPHRPVNRYDKQSRRQ